MFGRNNKKIALQFLQAVWIEGKLEMVDQLVAPDFVDHNPTPGFAPNREGLREFVLHFRSAFPDLKLELEDLICEGNRVVDRWSMRATHQGEFLGIPPTGKAVTLAGIDILSIVGGKIVEGWHFEDQLGAMQQLGAITSPFQEHDE
jgi:steroid delta-isomerase-like uncharacterized protein